MPRKVPLVDVGGAKLMLPPEAVAVAAEAPTEATRPDRSRSSVETRRRPSVHVVMYGTVRTRVPGSMGSTAWMYMTRDDGIDIVSFNNLHECIRRISETVTQAFSFSLYRLAMSAPSRLTPIWDRGGDDEAAPKRDVTPREGGSSGRGAAGNFRRRPTCQRCAVSLSVSDAFRHVFKPNSV